MKAAVYAFALARYTDDELFNVTTGPLLLADLQTVFEKERALVVVSDFYDGASETLPPIHFAVSGHHEKAGSLPLERRLVGRGLREPLDRLKHAEWVKFEDLGIPRLGRLYRRDHRTLEGYQRKPVTREWLTQGDEEAASETLSQFSQLEQMLGGPAPGCIEQVLPLGNGDMAEGWAAYLSQFALD